MKPTAILFVSPLADRTGAPIELLRFLGWFRDHSPHRILVLLQKSGEMETDFCALGSTRVWKRPLKTANRWSRKFKEILRWEAMGNYLRWIRIRCWLLRFRVVLVYANTAFVGESLAALENLTCPRVCRLHELEYTLRNFRYPFGFPSFQMILRVCSDYIAVSDAVVSNLRKSYGVPLNRIHKVHGSIVSVDTDCYLDPRRILALKKELGIPRDAGVVGGCGWIQWRKGPDLFVQLAGLAGRLGRNDVHFVWLGGDRKLLRFRQLEFDVDRAGLRDRVHLITHQADPYPFYALIDVLAMVSREDPFPLVNLEAGLLGKPMVCFQGSGGSEEWARLGCGRIVPYLNLEAFIRSILDLIDRENVREEMADRCRREARGLLVERNAPRIHRIDFLTKFPGEKNGICEAFFSGFSV